MISWTNNDYLYGVTSNFEYKENIAAFDIDGTIITTKSNRVFPKDEFDWKFLYNTSINKLQEYYENNYCIIFISNQGGLKSIEKKESWKRKMEVIVKEINLPICIFASTENYIYRKPFPTIWKIIKSNTKISKKNSFYCGDAAGREKDHNDTDYKFALNCKTSFMVPEECFLENPLKEIEKKTINYSDIETLPLETDYIFYPRKSKELIIMVGYPGSGKSTIANNYLDYIIINQDSLKTKKKCLETIEKNMILDKNIVIDNMNYTKEKRKEFINIAKKYNYCSRAIFLETSYELSKHNMLYRYYITNGEIKRVPDLVYRIFEVPEIEEGFYKIDKVTPYKLEDETYKYYFY
jgi:bifunctional polynucleotide phosphatase/kinase